LLKIILFLITILFFNLGFAMDSSYTLKAFAVTGMDEDQTKIFQYYTDFNISQNYTKGQIDKEINATVKRIKNTQYYALIDTDYTIEGESFSVEADLTAQFPFGFGPTFFGWYNAQGKGCDYALSWGDTVKAKYIQKPFLGIRDSFEIEAGVLTDKTLVSNLGFASSFSRKGVLANVLFGIRQGYWTNAVGVGYKKNELANLVTRNLVSVSDVDAQNQDYFYLLYKANLNTLDKLYVPDSGIDGEFLLQTTNKNWNKIEFSYNEYKPVHIFSWYRSVKLKNLTGVVPYAEYYYQDELRQVGDKYFQVYNHLRYNLGDFSFVSLNGLWYTYLFYDLEKTSEKNWSEVFSNCSNIYGVGISFLVPFYYTKLDCIYQIADSVSQFVIKGGSTF